MWRVGGGGERVGVRREGGTGQYHFSMKPQ